MSTEQRPLTPEEVDTLHYIRELRQEGMLIHAMPTHVGDGSYSTSETTLLAERGGFCTTSMDRDPGTRREFIARRVTDRMLELLANNCRSALTTLPWYREDQADVGMRVAADLRSVVAAHGDGVRLGAGADTRKIVADRIDYHVRAEQPEMVARVAGILGVLMAPMTVGCNRPVVPNMDPDRPMVRVYDMTEFDPRVMGSGLTRMLATELNTPRYGNFTYPPDKLRPTLLRRRGETFSPLVEPFLRGIQEDYIRMRVMGITASYADYSNTYPAVRDEALITEPAALFEATRKIFNGLIHRPDVRGSSDLNTEQDEVDLLARLLIELNVLLIRETVEAPAEFEGISQQVAEREGPPAPAVPAVTDRYKRKMTTEFKKNPVVQSLLGGMALIGFGAEAVIGGAIRHSPVALKTAEQYYADLAAYRQRRKDVASQHEALDEWVAREIAVRPRHA